MDCKEFGWLEEAQTRLLQILTVFMMPQTMYVFFVNVLCSQKFIDTLCFHLMSIVK